MHYMKNILLILFLTSCIANLNATENNCNIKLNISNVDTNSFIYINRDTTFYYNSEIKGFPDSICFDIDNPIGVTLFINNDAENSFQFYLCEGNYNLNIDVKNKTAQIIGSPLNDDYKEMMRVNDSMFKKYKIMHAKLYPYNGMDRDSAHAWLQKYLPLCNELSDKHSEHFYETNLSSFITLEHIYVVLQYTFEDPSYDTIEYDIKKLKMQFDKLDTKLKKYAIYNECLEMFSKEHIKPPLIAKPLWDGK